MAELAHGARARDPPGDDIGQLAREDRPRFVIGTGGYAAGATMTFAARRGIPLFIQEQNSFPGRTVRTFSRYAREIYLGFPEGGDLLPGAARSSRGVYRQSDCTAAIAAAAEGPARRAWELTERGTVILVFGGSQGSAALNAVIDAWVAARASRWRSADLGDGQGALRPTRIARVRHASACGHTSRRSLMRTRRPISRSRAPVR